MTVKPAMIPVERFPPAPEHLSSQRREFWVSVVREFDLSQPDLQVLRLLCEQLDVAALAQEELAASGPFRPDRFGIMQASPAVAVLRDATTLVARLARQLDLEVEAPMRGERWHVPRVGVAK